jgi:hypothetical protein
LTIPDCVGDGPVAVDVVVVAVVVVRVVVVVVVGWEAERVKLLIGSSSHAGIGYWGLLT